MDSGYLSRNEELRETFRKRLGIKGIYASQAFQEMDKAIVAGVTETAVMNANWPAMKRLLPIISSPTYHSMTHGIKDEDTYENSQDIMDIIEGLSKEEVHILITNMLTDELAKILQLPADKVEQNRSIQDLGVDSLMAMELVSAIENRFSIEIPIMAMSDNSTVDSIAARIARILTGDKNLEQGPDSDVVMVRTLAATHAEEFSETEIDEFTREYVEDKSKTRRMIQ
jgi:phthiocerol/phenolphthiocerol synthesis type-I polyketide synthase C